MVTTIVEKEHTGDVLDLAISIQHEYEPVTIDEPWLDDDVLVADAWPGIDIELARVRQMGAVDMLRSEFLQDMADSGVLGLGVLAEAQRALSSSRTQTIGTAVHANPLCLHAAHFSVQLDDGGRAPFGAASNHLRLTPSDTLTLRVNGKVLGRPLVELVRDANGWPVSLSSKGRLSVPKGTQAWLQRVWGLSAIPALTVSGPATDVVAFLTPSVIFGEVMNRG